MIYWIMEQCLSFKTSLYGSFFSIFFLPIALIFVSSRNSIHFPSWRLPFLICFEMDVRKLNQSLHYFENIILKSAFGMKHNNMLLFFNCYRLTKYFKGRKWLRKKLLRFSFTTIFLHFVGKNLEVLREKLLRFTEWRFLAGKNFSKWKLFFYFCRYYRSF